SIWRNHRRLLNPAFSQVVLDSFIGVFNSQSRRLVEALDKEIAKGPFDHWVLEKRKTDYLKNMETCKNDKTGAFTDREIREHVDTMIVGGHDTSANVLMITLVLIGSFPEVQEKIFEELRQVFGKDDRDVTKQDLSQLVYTEAVLKESMRIYPIVPVTARMLDKDVKLKNCTLTRGRTCFTFVYGVHRHPVWGSDAEEFKPERWLDPTTLPESPHAFAAFNMGRRICIGKSYAYMSMKTTLAHLMRRYKIQADHTKLKFKIDVMLKPSDGHSISIQRREEDEL
ncbi:unnamed protein product, partial [Leptidea sinapis]